MPAPDMQSFVSELEQRGWLKRIRVEVDPILEISAIADRVTKAGGPALLFERVRGSTIPVLINTFGTRERMCLALGAESFDEIAERVQALVKPEIPTTLMEKIKKIPQLMQLGSLPPRIVRRGVCQEVVHTDDADLTALPAIKCWPGDGDLSANTYPHVRELLGLAEAARSEAGRRGDAGGAAGGRAAGGRAAGGRGSCRAAGGENAGYSSGPVDSVALHGGKAEPCTPGPGGKAEPCTPMPAGEADLCTPNERRLRELLKEASEHARWMVERQPLPDPRGLIPPPNDGRYLTLTNVFTKHPETGERNIGMYRVHILGPKLAAMHWHMHHDGARHFRAYHRLNQRMPIAVSFGGPAVMPYAATCPLPPGIDECLFAGFLNGGAIELVPCVSQPDLEVPATAEIVVEGFIDPADPPIVEGPFGDHTGFYSLADLYPRMHVTAITHRRNPIYPTTIVGKPPQEDFWLGKTTERIFLPLLRTIVPDIIDYNLPMFGCFHNCAFVRIRKEYPWQARRVMSAIWGAGQMAFTKIIVVVDEHVDVQDEQAVLFHLCANVDPKRDIMFVDGPLDILDHASPSIGVGSKMGIDATRKVPGEGVVRDWPGEIEMAEEVRARVRRRWAEYGL